MRLPRCNQIPLHSAAALKFLLGLSLRPVGIPYTLTPRIPLYTAMCVCVRERDSSDIQTHNEALISPSRVTTTEVNVRAAKQCL